MTAAAALGLYLAYLVVMFGVRAWLLYRRTGTTGYNGLSGPPGSPSWWGGVLFIVALLAGLAAPVLQLLDLIEPIGFLTGTTTSSLGLALALAGAALSLAAQQAMGRSWRVGVNSAETTGLVCGGIFAVVRNPFFAALLITATGLALMAPNAAALAALAALILATELQVRAVEEPYLIATHGDTYLDYGRAVGRFLPGLGRINGDRHAPPPSGSAVA